MWASLLSNEASKPDTISPATIDTLSRIRKADLRMLTVLSRYSWRLFIGGDTLPRHLVFYPELARQAEHRDGGGGYLAQLQMLGVVSWSEVPLLLWPWAEDRIDVGYYGKWMRLFPRHGNSVIAGKLFLTSVGSDLLDLVDCEPNEAVFNATVEHWKGNGVGSARLKNALRPNPDKVDFVPSSTS